MTLPIKSAKTAKEMLEAVCEDLEKYAQHWKQQGTEARQQEPRTVYVVFAGLRAGAANKAAEYRAILKEME
ncbi:MAG: hypothetical protein J0H10_17115 [Alphaproteobacteria bacterium]|nr:hypothetical protein [Alphaproteobacteria bacterium]